jgi:hypothetical protein
MEDDIKNIMQLKAIESKNIDGGTAPGNLYEGNNIIIVIIEPVLLRFSLVSVQ